MIALLRQIRDFLVSLKLTVVLLTFGMLLIFAATLDQVNLGILAVQEKYFQSFVVYTRLGNLALPVFPGGYAVGGLLLANLIAAHVYRFAFAWKKLGIFLIHAGLILLLVGELLSGLWQEDHHMRIAGGETKNYAESFHFNELVLIDTSDSAVDRVVAIPEKLLEQKTTIQHPQLPFRVVTKTYYPNSTLQSWPQDDAARAGGAAPAALAMATAGLGERIVVAPKPVTYRPNEQNVPSAFVELSGTEGSLGTYLVSTQIAEPQQFAAGGRTWKIALRTKRTYYPFTLTLLKFSHDRYAGTDIPKNFSSRLRVETPGAGDAREVLIYMNNPLRFAGLTFYQAGFENDDRTTILQVVRNPSWLMPYIACGLMTLGLLVQFGTHLLRFVKKRAGVSVESSSPPRERRDATSGVPSATVPALTRRATQQP